MQFQASLVMLPLDRARLSDPDALPPLCIGEFVAVTGYLRMEGGSGEEFVGLLEERSQGKVKRGDVLLMVTHPTVNPIKAKHETL